MLIHCDVEVSRGSCTILHLHRTTFPRHFEEHRYRDGSFHEPLSIISYRPAHLWPHLQPCMSAWRLLSLFFNLPFCLYHGLALYSFESHWSFGDIPSEKKTLSFSLAVDTFPLPGYERFFSNLTMSKYFVMYFNCTCLCLQAQFLQTHIILCDFLLRISE